MKATQNYQDGRRPAYIFSWYYLSRSLYIDLLRP
jgi:hypothetical protein